MNKKSINNTRDYNRKRIIEYILQSGSNIMQSEIKSALGLDNSTIKRICDTLVDDEILVDENIIINTKGRRPRPYSLNPQHSKILVVIIGTDKFQLFNFNANLTINDKEVTYNQQELSFEQKLELITKTAQKYHANYCVIVTSGIIDNTNRILLNYGRLNQKNFAIADYFEQKLQIPVYAENNMNVATIYHLNKNLNQDKNNTFALINSQKGLGAGFIINNQLYRGKTGSAGEIGHQFYQPTTSQCYCKRSGCLELFLSTNKFSEHGININSVTEFNQLKNINNQLYIKLVTEFAKTAAHLLRNLENTMNLSTVYVTGLIFEILLHEENYHFFSQELHENIIQTQLEYIEISEHFFQYGGAIIGLKNIFELN